MKTVDVGAMIVIYNLVIGVLLMLASDKIASFVQRLGERGRRYAKVSVFALGSCIAAVSGTIYVAFHVLRLGVD